MAKRHLKEGTIVLCDVSSSYVEGEHNELAAFGYNRDGKKQIAIGLLTDEAGCPVPVEVFKGNTGDPTTVASQVAKLQQRFQLKQVVLVGDRGLMTHARIRMPHGLDWISALKRDPMRQVVEQENVQLTDERNLIELRCDLNPMSG